MKRASLITLVALFLAVAGYAQAPAAPAQNPAPKPAAPPASAASIPAGGVATVDFTRALTSNVEGVKATNKLQAEGSKRQNEFQAKVKEGQDAQSKLQTGGAVMN